MTLRTVGADEDERWSRSRRSWERSFKFVLLSFLASLLVVGALPPAAPASEGDLEVELVPKTPSQVRLGGVFKLELVARNPTDETKRFETSVLLRRLDGSGEEVVFKRVTTAVFGGNRVSRTNIEVTTGTWFDRKGPYEVSLEEYPSVPPLAFDVIRSKVRVPRFEDVTDEAGLTTTLGDFPCGAWSAGAAWGDFDGDGDLDLFLPRQEISSHLFINDGTGHFTDEASTRGVAGALGLSASAADYDNDDDLDLYVAVEGPNRLLQNDGIGQFEDVTSSTGVGGDAPTQGGSWGDYDRDGHIDLYVSNHSRCTPDFDPYSDILYHNNGDGTFDDRTHLIHGGGTESGSAFQGTWFDAERDGDLDLFVANDHVSTEPQPNQMWRNDGPGEGEWRFTNIAIPAGIAVRMNSMGVGVFDYDRDLDFDLAISNIRSPAVLRNDDDGTFTDVANRVRVNRTHHNASSVAITWGVVAADFNNDGWEDLYIPSGRLRLNEFLQPMDYQPNEVYTNNRKAKFLDHSAPSGADDTGHSRAAALADFDGDGRMDIFSVNQLGQPRLFRNVTKKRRHRWLAVEVRGRDENTRACGAVVIARIKGGGRLLRQVMCGGAGLGSSNDSVLHFGLGPRWRVRKLTVKWLSGKKAIRRGIKTNRRIRVMEPAG